MLLWKITVLELSKAIRKLSASVHITNFFNTLVFTETKSLPHRIPFSGVVYALAALAVSRSGRCPQWQTHYPSLSTHRIPFNGVVYTHAALGSVQEWEVPSMTNALPVIIDTHYPSLSTRTTRYIHFALRHWAISVYNGMFFDVFLQYWSKK